MVAQGRRRRRTLGRRRLKRSRATLRKRNRTTKPSCMIGGMPTPIRQIYCDTYRNFMLLAVYLGWQCDQDVFPARMRASQPEEAVCSTLERMEQLAGLAQPSEYSIKFSISNGDSPAVVVTWRAYVFDLSDMAYKGRIIYESKSNEECYIEALTYDEFKLLTRCAYKQSVGSGVIETLAEKETSELLGSRSNPNFSRIFHTSGKCYALRRSELRDEPWLRTWAGIFMGNGDRSAILQLSGDNSLTGNVGFKELREQAQSMQEKISKRETAVGAIASMGRIAWSFVPGAGAIAELGYSAEKITSLTASGIAYVKDKLSETLPVYVEVVDQAATEAGVKDKVEARAEDAVSKGKERMAQKLIDRVIYGRKSADTGDNAKLEFVPFPITMETMEHRELKDIGDEIEAHLRKEKEDTALRLFLRRSCYGMRKADIAASQPLSGIVASLDTNRGNSMLDTVTAVQAGLESVEQSNVSDLERRQAQLSDEIARAKTKLAKLYEVGKQSELLTSLNETISQIQALLPMFREPDRALEAMFRGYARRTLDDQTRQAILSGSREGSEQKMLDLFARADKKLGKKDEQLMLTLFEKACSRAQGGLKRTNIASLRGELPRIEDILEKMQQTSQADAKLNEAERRAKELQKMLRIVFDTRRSPDSGRAMQGIPPGDFKQKQEPGQEVGRRTTTQQRHANQQEREIAAAQERDAFGMMRAHQATAEQRSARGFRGKS